ncbi:MAG: sulfotransferase domain-containing protein [Solirubrobacterales bacterium]|nr:sulfotransferase domain-containing protein [Solirubrobacterales bacterium]
MEASSATGRAALADAPSGAVGALPNLIVIGAQKCGTSGLHYYLGLHPQVSVSRLKEVNFFIAERNWTRGLDWYQSHFDAASAVRVEASPNYTAHPHFAGVPERMHAVVPDAKLVFSVRDPIDRIASHWVHNHAKGRDRGDIGSTILSEKTTYISRSRYHMQLELFLRFYPLDRIFILDVADLRSRREQTLAELFRFAGVDPSFEHRGFQSVRHRSDRKTRPTPLGERLLAQRARVGRRRGILPRQAWDLAFGHWPLGRRIERPEVRGALPAPVIELLRDDARKLGELTGRSFGHWSIWES